jgi:CheY-like chemotaxis protein
VEADKKQKIMIVDDLANLRWAVALEFRELGYDVVEAECGNEALKILQNESVDVILSDIRMPNGTGIELLDNLRAIHADQPPVIFMSAFSDFGPEIAFSKGAERIYPKPFEMNDLREAVEQCLIGKEKFWSLPYKGKALTPIEISMDQLSVQATQKSLKSERVVLLGRGGIFIPSPHINTTSDPLKLVHLKLQFLHGPVPQLECIGSVKWKRFNDGLDTQAGCGISFLRVMEPSAATLIKLTESCKAFIPLGSKK